MKNPNQPDPHLAVGQPLLQEVRLVHRYSLAPETRSQSWSLPGHLLQFTRSGTVTLTVDGHEHRISKGDLLWLYETQHIVVQVGSGPWEFDSVNLMAPELLPPDPASRQMRVGRLVQSRVEALSEAWRNTGLTDAIRRVQVQGLGNLLLADLLAGIEEPLGPATPRGVGRVSLWWQVESLLRARLDEPITMEDIVELAGYSAATMTRACRQATDQSPMQRLRTIRLQAARGLIRFSTRPISEIAHRVGYRRVQELSRDYGKAFGLTPTADRRHEYPN